MTGREEIDFKNEQWITNKLQELPEILTDYMYSIKSKTSWSRRNYLGYLIQFFGYLESKRPVSFPSLISPSIIGTTPSKSLSCIF